MGIYRFPLEPYKARYTEFLSDWETEAFAKEGLKSRIVFEPSGLPEFKHGGSVLDKVRRPTYCLQQIENFIKMDLEDTSEFRDPIYFSDFYTTGLDALAYSGRSANRRIGAFNWAQTFDIYDFTFKEHAYWMRNWEAMALGIYTDVFVADRQLAEIMLASFAGMPALTCDIHPVGLPFNSIAVYNHLAPTRLKTYDQREIDVVYTSRLDKEKNPMLFVQLIRKNPNLKFAICTGHEQLYGNDDEAIHELKVLERESRLAIFTNLSKRKYYEILSNSKIQFNCASQDWVSYTLLEALTFGCAPVYPNFRSFPSALNYEGEYLYKPGSSLSASETINSILAWTKNSGISEEFRLNILNYHDSSLQKIANIMKEPFYV